MDGDDLAVIQAAAGLGNGQPRLIEYCTLASHTGLAEADVRRVAGGLRQRGLCIATFGGIQLTAAGFEEIQVR